MQARGKDMPEMSLLLPHASDSPPALIITAILPDSAANSIDCIAKRVPFPPIREYHYLSHKFRSSRVRTPNRSESRRSFCKLIVADYSRHFRHSELPSLHDDLCDRESWFTYNDFLRKLHNAAGSPTGTSEVNDLRHQRKHTIANCILTTVICYNELVCSQDKSKAAARDEERAKWCVGENRLGPRIHCCALR